MATALLPQRSSWLCANACAMHHPDLCVSGALQNDLVLAETKNNSIIPANILEENRKQVNDVYLKTLAVDKTEFDAMQTTTLESIACQDALDTIKHKFSLNLFGSKILFTFIF